MSQAEMLPAFSEASTHIKVGKTYRHYKGNLYKVVAIARHSETLEEIVVYQALSGEKEVWVRPLHMFLESLLLKGKMEPRFTLFSAS